MTGYVTHASDRCLWAYRIPNLITDYERRKGLEWLDAVDREVEIVEREGHPGPPLDQALMLREDHSIGWSHDARWEHFLSIANVLPGEGKN